MLTYLDNLISEVPPEPTQGRFGNKSFKVYHDRFDSQLDIYLTEIIKYIPAENTISKDEILLEIRG